MRKDKLYLLTFFSIATIVFLISIVAVEFFIRESSDKVFELQIENSKREINEVSKLISSQVSQGIPKETVIKNLQKVIQNTNSQTSFISMLDWSGKQLAHPDKTKVGVSKDSKESSLFPTDGTITPKDLRIILANGGEVNKSETQTKQSHIILLAPIENSDLIVASHLNTERVLEQVSSLKKRFYLIFMFMGIMLVLSSFFAVRILGSTYEKSLEIANKKLENELVNISKLNSTLVAYQQKVKENDANNEISSSDLTKKRILTYLRDELLTIPIETIAYIYVDHTITYVVCFDGKKSTTNSSLDELFTSLNNVNFFRANRQVIIAVQAIQKIVRYGNNQLKILIQPKSDIDIIIGKNKASEFKQWLNL